MSIPQTCDGCQLFTERYGCRPLNLGVPCPYTVEEPEPVVPLRSDTMEEIVGQIVVCLTCGAVFEWHEGDPTELPCGHPLCVHYTPDEWLAILDLGDQLAMVHPHCKAQDSFDCRMVGRLTEQRLRHMPLQVS